MMLTPARSTSFDDTIVALREYSDNPSAFLALNKNNRYFRGDCIPGVISYREFGKYWIQFGGPFAPPGERKGLLLEFLSAAARSSRKVVAIQLQASDAELYAANGFVVNQVGASYAIDLSRYGLHGKRFVRLRNKVSRAQRAGLQISEVDLSECRDKVAAIDSVWLRSKGRHVKELEFLVGELDGDAQQYRRLFLGTIDEKPTCYISYSPVFGSRSGWLHDLSRRIPDSPPGVMEAINVHAIAQFRSEGTAWLHFGFTPFSGLNSAWEMQSVSKIAGRLVRLLADHGNSIYPAQTQVEYKAKWYPDAVLPEYLGFQGSVSLRAVWSILRLTKSI